MDEKSQRFNLENVVTLAIFLFRAKYMKLKVKGKGKAIPLQAWTGPEGSRSLRLPDFKTVGT